MNESTKSWAIIALLGFIVVVMIFMAGVVVGSHKSGRSSFGVKGHQMGGGFDKTMMLKKAAIGVKDVTSEAGPQGGVAPSSF